MDDLCEHKARLEKELEISKNSELFLSRKVAKLEIQKTQQYSASVKLQERFEILNQSYNMLVSESKEEKGEQMSIEDFKHRMLSETKRYKELNEQFTEKEKNLHEQLAKQKFHIDKLTLEVEMMKKQHEDFKRTKNLEGALMRKLVGVGAKNFEAGETMAQLGAQDENNSLS